MIETVRVVAEYVDASLNFIIKAIMNGMCQSVIIKVKIVKVKGRNFRGERKEKRK